VVAGSVSGTAGQWPPPGPAVSGRAKDGPVLPRRLLFAGAGVVFAGGAGTVAWQASRPSAGRPPTAARRRALPRRAALWQATVSVPRPRVMAAAGGVVCVAADTGPYAPQSRARDVVQALNASDGLHRWTFTVRVGTPGGSFVDPPGLAVSGGRVYVAADRLSCLRASDGTQLWSASPALVSSWPVAGPEAVYIAPMSLCALSRRDGTLLWTVTTGVTSAPILINGVLYLLTAGSRRDPRVLAVRASDGTKLWDSPGPQTGWLASDGQILCAVSGSGVLDPDAEPPPGDQPPPAQMWTWRASNGQLLWKSAPDAGFGAAPATTAGIACALTAGPLIAVDPASGRPLWTYPATSPPVAANGKIYTTTPARHLIALNATDGTPAWTFPAPLTLGPLLADNTIYICDHTTIHAVPA